MKSNSWIVTEVATGAVMFETFLPSVAAAVNTEKYLVQTSYDYLCGLNRKIKEARTT